MVRSLERDAVCQIVRAFPVQPYALLHRFDVFAVECGCNLFHHELYEWRRFIASVAVERVEHVSQFFFEPRRVVLPLLQCLANVVGKSSPFVPFDCVDKT